MFNYQIYLFMPKSHNPVEDNMSFVTIKVDDHCVINLTRPSSNPEKPLQRQYLAVPGDHFRISVSPLSPVTIGVIPFSMIPESLKTLSDEEK